jgi:L-fucose mutarotase/ribose pyranase (RbsD/FucU family)
VQLIGFYDLTLPGNPMSWIMSIEPLIRANYPQWKKMVNMGLALFEIDNAITDKRLVEPTPKEIPDDVSHEVKAHKEKENAKLMECYQIEKFNWERSNHMCLMVIKERISESI